MRGPVLAVACGLATSACSLLLLDDDFSGGPITDVDRTEAGLDATLGSDGPRSDASDATSEAAPIADPYATVIRQDTPLAWWRFEDNVGKVIVDEMGTHDISVADPDLVTFGKTGAVGRAIELDGHTELPITGTFDLSAGKSFSIEAWVQNTDTADFYRRIFAKLTLGTNGPADGTYLWINAGKDATGFERWKDKLAQDVVYWHLPSTTAFTHLVVVVGTGRTLMYANGALVVSGDKESPGAANDPVTPVVLGSQFVGLLDEIAFYDKPLGAERVKAHYDAAMTK